MASLIHEKFREQARRTPDGVAVRHGDQAVTYADLDKQVERAAAALLDHGIREGRSVGLYLNRSIPWVVGTLAILRTNAAVVPLPPSYPAGRLREILSFAELDAVVDHASTPLDATLAERIWRLEELSAAGGEEPHPAPGDPHQPAFVLCSSGSTGRQKMIVRSHRSFFHRLEWTWKRHPYEPHEVCCQKAHQTTTHSIYELFEPLLRGVPVLIIPDQNVRNLELFWETIRSQGITRLLIVPSALRASLDMPGFQAPPLRVVVLMGEYVDPDLAERAVEAFPPPTYLCSIYGSTEASSTLLCNLRELLRPGEELPLGRPISDDVLPMVLGEDMGPVPAGDAGRLYMAGAALFTEYFRSPDLTGEIIVTDASGRERLCDTRDQVRLLPDGNLEYIGRVDHTVKIRGFRVNTQEVESAIRGHDGVRDAAVVVGDNGAGGASLFAFVAPAEVDRSAVFQRLRDTLPDYMVPSVVTALDSFPLTPSGKVDRVRLLEKQSGAAADAPDDDALSETEAMVRQVMRGVVGHAGIALDSNFFEIGGTSLTVFTLVLRLREAFDLGPDELGERAVYRFPSVGELAGHIDAVRDQEAPDLGAGTPLTVLLRRGSDPERPPFFVVSSAGGTLGAYEKLAKALDTPRDVIGIRDSFLWGERDPTEGFQRWVGHYVDAIRERQPEGPYHVGAYSSAGAYGYEIARRLRQSGQEVALLVLIDPLGIDSRDKWRYGHWANRATYMRPSYREAVRWAGRLRAPALRLLNLLRPAQPASDTAFSAEQVRQITEETLRSKKHVAGLSALFEINTGLPFTLSEDDFSGKGPDELLGVLQSRIASLMPDIDADMIERILVQYQLQARSQHAYELLPYDGRVLLVEPDTTYSGIVAAQLRAYVRRLQVRVVKLGPGTERELSVCERFGPLRTHFRSMRDDQFVQGLTEVLAPLLD